MDMNHWSGIGRLTRDPEARYLSSGKCVVKFSIACNGIKRGEKDEVLFLECEAWEKQAEAIAKYTAKSLRVAVEGRLKLDKWEARDGTTRSQIRLVAHKVQFIDWADDAKNAAVPDGSPTRPAPQSAAAAAVTDDDELPF